MKKIIFMLLSVLTLYATTYNGDYKDFTKINPDETTNIYGNLQITGNTVMCVTEKTSATLQDWENNYTNFACTDDINKNDNNYITRYIDIDNDTSTFNSSSAVIKLPSTYKEIVWAGLFWQGHINNYSYIYTDNNGRVYSYENDDYKDDDITKTDANKIKLKINNNNYVDIVANEVDYHVHTDYDAETYKEKGARYSAWADVTNIIKQYQYSANSDINITVANIATTEGLDENHGDYGAWSLVVIYKEDVNNPYSKLRNNSVYYGFEKVYDEYGDDAVNININNLVLPNKVGQKINTYMALFAAEGEYRYGPDTAKLNDEELNETLIYNGQEVFDPENVFDARLSDDIVRFPKLYNNNGIDIDIFNNVSDIMTELRDKNPGQLYYDVTITLESGPPNYNKYPSMDAYNPSVVVFSTELYQPRVCYYIDTITDDENNTVFENGEFVGNIDPNKKYNIKLWIANMKSSTTDTDIDTAKKVKVYMTTNDFNYTTESTFIKNIGYNDYVHQTDAPNDDLYTYLPDNNESDYHLGLDANATDGGTIDIATSFNDDAHKAFIDFNGSFVVDSNTTYLDLDDVFHFKASFATDFITIDENNALEIPKCVDFNTNAYVYSAVTGTFNVVNMDYIDQGTIPSDDTGVNALHTQIVNKNFNLRTVKVEDNNVTVEKYSGILKVSLIPANNFHSMTENEKLNLLNNAPELVSRYVSMGDSGNDPNYGEFNITYDKALKEGTFKIVYLVDSYGNIVESSSCFAGVPDYNCIWGMLTEVYTDANNQNSGTGSTSSGNNICPTGQNDESCECGIECEYGQNSDDNGNLGDQHASNTCLECVFGRLPTKASLARDSFTIRPNSFRLTAIPNKIKAGEFNLTVQALDYLGNPTVDYNETLTVEGNSPTFEYNDTNASIGCNRGVLDIIANAQFSNGEANITLKYNEVGDLNLTLKEVNGSEFALPDADDTNDSQRLITENSQVYTFIPHHFSIENLSFNNGGNNFTYISNDLNMSGNLLFKIYAKAEDNTTTQNYTGTCYAKNFEINVSHTVPTIDLGSSKLIYKETNTSEYNISKTDNMLLQLTKEKFVSNGVADIDISINFEKNYSTPVAGFDFNVTEVNMSDEDDINGTSGILTNKQVHFIYGRIKTSNSAAYSSDVNTTFEYQYWSDAQGWVKNSDHNSTTYGDFNHTLDSTINPYVSVTNNPVINGGEEKVVFHTSHALPYSAKVHLQINSWLWYHPLAKDYQDPSSTNTDCLTHPCIKLDFLKSGSAWGGVQAVNNTQFSEENRTSEMNMSKPDVNVSKSQVKKINW